MTSRKMSAKETNQFVATCTCTYMYRLYLKMVRCRCNNHCRYSVVLLYTLKKKTFELGLPCTSCTVVISHRLSERKLVIKVIVCKYNSSIQLCKIWLRNNK